MKIHLVDGTYELFRHFFAVPSHLNSANQEVAATRAAVGSLLLLLEDGATHIAVATDEVITSFRNELYPHYKTGDGIDPALASQFLLFQEVATAAGFAVWPMVEFEADDAIATAAATAQADPQVRQVIICSPDKDFTQCLTPDRKVVQYDRRRQHIIDYEAAREKFGMPPEAMPDYLALVGDSADGIKGITHWGAKSTATALAHYGRLEDIPAEPGKWEVALRGIPKLAASLAEHQADAQLFKQLATLRTDVPGLGAPDEWRWTGPQAGFGELCRQIDAPKLSDRAAALAKAR